MKVGDLVKFRGSWYEYSHKDRKVGIVAETWTNGRTKQITSADILWNDGHLGNIMIGQLEVINEH